jgi:hypothetical protein
MSRVTIQAEMERAILFAGGASITPSQTVLETGHQFRILKIIVTPMTAFFSGKSYVIRLTWM